MIFDPLLLLVDLLAIYRLTRLVVKDSLLNTPRWWILRRWPSELTEFPDAIVNHGYSPDGMVEDWVEGNHVFKSRKTDEDGDPIWLPEKTHKITELIECGFCASVWISFAIMAVNPWHGWITYVLSSLALAGGVALVFTRWDNE